MTSQQHTNDTEGRAQPSSQDTQQEGSVSASTAEEAKQQKQIRGVPLRMIVPNIVTLLGLCAGLTSIRMALEARWDIAVGAIILAAVLDGLDGRVARMLKGTSRFGAELDSLADFVNFGVAPAILLYAWMLQSFDSIGWIAALLYAICGALRLARFNVALDDPNKPDWAGKFFTGVPAPAGAVGVLLPVYLEKLGLPHWEGLAPLVALYTVGVGLLMVSQLPTFSGKQLGTRVRREFVLPIIVIIIAFVGLLLSYPYELLSVITLSYLAIMPLAWRSYRAHRKAGDKGQWSNADDSLAKNLDEETL
ncbi:CDP-diacylglycerol--serine O-phosphatidyltransferase [Polycladidibacter hongkongensis]|uniref:CDP-diacylglycerol--serine O-phosphatidyltransferase n=1 Tax=Polycladidibacter hongkongensis TaxID=1647556 RepID=UPI0009EA508A|nr:CDP-diacylglycerol--serine O-phosphatidyltransferase [Pseudovibrio hongkongensis]